MMYVPGVLVSTVPLTTALHVPSTISLHSAPSSEYVSPASMVILLDPFRVIIGFVVSSTITVLVTVLATFPLLSV
jgi:hypothetical protein